jgi:hypothetical protein
VLLAAAVAGMATVAGANDLDWWTVDGGGGRCAGSGTAMTFTIGQSDAGPPAIGGDFILSGGFWTGSNTPPETPLFADDFESGGTAAWSSSTGGSMVIQSVTRPNER